MKVPRELVRYLRRLAPRENSPAIGSVSTIHLEPPLNKRTIDSMTSRIGLVFWENDRWFQEMGMGW